ncbi:MAG: efflux RND transporter periplasmic adaptor subunit [Acidobacteriota bacterium]
MNARRILGWVLTVTVLGALALTVACSDGAASEAKYRCPMHPSVVTDGPGDCPVCGMRLVPSGAEGSQTPHAAHPVYICPMHPQVSSDRPGDCPICGMRLVEKKAKAVPPSAPAASMGKTMYRSTMNPSEVSDRPGKDSMGMEMVPFEAEPSSEGSVPGRARVTIQESHQRHMNLATSLVEPRKLAREVRTSARIVAAEPGLYSVTTKVEGWVERLYVNATGQAVRRGQPLLSIYSPELLATQEEYLAALSSFKRLSASSIPGVSLGGSDLLAAARRRLALWDVSEAQIRAIEETGKAQRTVTLYAPATGYVSEKTVLQGQKIMPGQPLLTVSDLTTVWAEAALYESDLGHIRVGMPVTLALPYWPGRSFSGKVSFINPFLDPETRTLQARLEIPNPDLLLKPEMYGDMTLSYDLGEKLAVPVSAVLRTGTRTFVFLRSGEADLVPTEVVLGERSGEYYEVVAGLGSGDRVVTSANFLVDSESSLKSALQAVTVN